MRIAKLLVPILPVIILAAGAAHGQTPNPIPAAYSASTVNYTRVWTPTAPEQNSSNLLIRPLTDVKQLTEYSDGFGRPIQSVRKAASPAGNDMVVAHCYDPTTGLELFRYLAFTANVATAGDITNDGNFKTDAFQQQTAFYNTYLSGQTGETSVGTGGANWAYNKTVYEASPLARPLTNYTPGSSWVGSQTGTAPGHNTTQEFLLNTVTDNVRIWNIPGWTISNPELSSSIIPTSSAAYSAGTLYKTIATDEQGLQTIEFRDQYGQTILRKQQLQNSASPLDNGSGSGYTGWLCTYYVYDDHGSIRFVIPPNVVAQMAAASWSISQTQADELCYRFEYDQLGQMIVKKTPGTPTGNGGEVWMIYDQRHRLVMQQDGNQRAAKQWLYTQYDNLDRPVSQGIITDLTYYNNLSYHVTGAATSGNNSSGVSAWPVLSAYSANEVLSQIWYDNYNNIPAPLSKTIDVSTNGAANSAFTTAYNVSPAYAQPLTQSLMLQGLVTGTNAEVLGTNGGQHIPAVNFYDEKGRVIQTQSVNVSTGKDIGTTQYNWIGEPLATLEAQAYSSSTNPQTHLVATAMTYDVIGRLLTVKKTINSTVNGVTVSSPATTIATDQYDELSRLQKTTLGNNLESLTYAYNVRGWLRGINQGYIAGSSSNYFGLELGYDKSTSGAPGNSFLNPIFNGNTSGAVWKTKGDGIPRKYDLSYDNLSRLTGAAFLQNSSGSAWDKSYIDFTVSGIGYDGNGNMTAMQQNGFAQGGSKPIDQLSYNYISGAGNSNRLVYVSDNANVTNSTLGDFHYPGSAKTAASVDYTYDADGNTISDANRSISAISYYSYPNLPKQITTPKGTITYTYDASGAKLKKTIVENGLTINGTATTLTTTAYYVDGAEYKTVNYTGAALASLNSTDVLQFFGTEDGRLRFKPALGTVPAQFVHDYLIRDQLGNVRVGITDETQQDIYPAATGETTSVTAGGTTSTAQTYESQYYSFNPSDFVATTSLPSWFSAMSGSAYPNENGSGIPANNDPYSQTTTTSAKVFQVCGNIANNTSGDNFGLGITLKVMAGDVVNIYGLSFWHNTGTLPAGSYPVSSVLTSLLGAFGGSAAVTSTLSHSVLGGSTFNTATSTPTATALSPMLSPATVQSGTQAPYAGVNYIIFDDQFKPQGTVVGFDPVSTTTDNIKKHSLSVTMPKNGYIFVYVSNQSNLNVYFDNLQVVQSRGPLLEETHYYPAGVAMAGISDRAWNKQPNYNHYQGKEMQDEEWHDGSGLEEYDFQARYYDPQLGRWNTQDPASQYASPYAGMGNNWPNGIDPDGRNFWSTLGAVGIIVGAAAAAYFTGGFGLMAVGPSLWAGGIVAATGYLGASWAGGSLNPGKWDANAWQGALAGVMVGASGIVSGAEFFEPYVSGVDAVSDAYGAGEASIVEHAANTVLAKLVTTETTSLITKHKNMGWQQAVGATISGAITGAFSGWNPSGPLMESDGTQFTGLGLGIVNPTTASYDERALVTLINTTGGGILNAALSGSNPYSKISVPLLNTGVTLTFGKKQALLQILSQGSLPARGTGALANYLFSSAGPVIHDVIKEYSSMVSNEIMQAIFDPRPKKK